MMPLILDATIMHSRLAPKKNEFRYKAFYLCLPLASIKDNTLAHLMAVDRAGPVSFYRNDHGDRKGGDLGQWLKGLLEQHGLGDRAGKVFILCMPRILGYVFNPVSFWFCLDGDDNLGAVLCEVNNTFGETHSYICAMDGKKPIGHTDWFEAKKEFHVSPFLERSGKYRFKFKVEEKNIAVRIDHYDEKGDLALRTSISGNLSPLNQAALKWALIKHPLLTFRVSFLIHWQAMKLFIRGVKVIAKPKQLQARLTRANKAQ